MKPIKTKWIFTIKHESNNNISKYKTGFVAKGYSQIRGIDYELTFSPTLSIDSVKLIISPSCKIKMGNIPIRYKSSILHCWFR